METIKISVDVSINFSESAKQFLAGLFNQPKNEVKPIVEHASQVPTQCAQTAKTQEPVKAAQSESAAPAVKTQASASSAIKIDQVRKALSEKVNDNRAAIKAKLEELGAPSVTKLDPSKYEELYNFLIQL